MCWIVESMPSILTLTRDASSLSFIVGIVIIDLERLEIGLLFCCCCCCCYVLIKSNLFLFFCYKPRALSSKIIRAFIFIFN